MEQVIGSVDFNYDEDEKEFGRGDRIVSIGYSKEDVIWLSFCLGRKEDDTVSVSLPLSEFGEKVFKAIAKPD